MIKTQSEQDRNIESQETKKIIRDEFGVHRIYTRASLIHVKRKHGDETIGAEVGVWTGDLSSVILAYVKPKKLYLLDSWAAYPDYIKELKSRNCNADYLEQALWDKMYQGVCERFKQNKEVNIIKGMSGEKIPIISDGELDWAYLDASHFEEYVYKDLVNWWPKIKSGGTLCGHDFLFPGIPPALERFSREMNIDVWPCGNDWWIDKK